jgi:hypothetical protein
MKKVFALILTIIFAMICLAACGGAQQPQASRQQTPVQQTEPTSINVVFSNVTDYLFNEIYISPTAANEWGSELLGSTSVLKSNGSVEVTIPAYDYNNYDIRVVDEDKYQYIFKYVPLESGSEVGIFFGDEGIAAEVYDAAGSSLGTVLGEIGGGADDGQGDYVEPTPEPTPEPTVTGTGNDTNGLYSFTAYNESSYDIYSIHMGIKGASSSYDIDILPQVLASGENFELSGIASQGDWLNTEWTLYITDVDGDKSASYDSFNPWMLSYVNINWDSNSMGYVCEFVY